MTEALAQLEAITGKDHLDEAMRVAIEASKLGLRVDDLMPAVRAWRFLQMLNIEPGPTQSVIAWSLEHGLTTPEQWAEAKELDLLGMRD